MYGNYPRFGTTYRPHLQRLMGSICCPEMSVTNYQSTLRNIPEDRRLRIHRGESLRSRKLWQKFTVISEECVVSSSRWNRILKMEIGSLSETLITFYQIARRYALQESGHLFTFAICSNVFFGNLCLSSFVLHLSQLLVPQSVTSACYFSYSATL